MSFRAAIAGVFAALASACVSFPDAPIPTTAPKIVEDAVIAFDGARLGLTAWEAEDPVALLVAVHGMNDYAAAYTFAGPWWAERGISVYAYDQRGFGRSPDFGRWPGGDALRQDLRAVIAAVKREHPDLPVYVIGHSMGAAVIMSAIDEAPLGVDGVILAAPGVWGGASMSLFYRSTLNLAAMFAPGETLTGERVDRQASDNIEFLRAMYRDPRVIKETRLDAILGAVRIMGDAWDASDEIGGDILFLYGELDEIIPVKALKKAARRLCGPTKTIAYPEGWHLLLADLQRETVFEDVAAWIFAQNEELGPRDGTGRFRPAVSSCAGENGDGGPVSAGLVAATLPGAG